MQYTALGAFLLPLNSRLLAANGASSANYGKGADRAYCLPREQTEGGRYAYATTRNFAQAVFCSYVDALNPIYCTFKATSRNFNFKMILAVLVVKSVKCFQVPAILLGSAPLSPGCSASLPSSGPINTAWASSSVIGVHTLDWLTFFSK